MNVTYRAVRMRITKWIKEEPDFFNLIYLGKSPPSITLDEFIEIKDRIQSNPLELKKHILSDIKDKRELRNEDTLSRATIYRRANQVELSLFTNKFWTDEEKSNFMRDPPLVNAINQGNWDIAKLKAIDRIVEYIRNGKITFKESYYYQDIGARISEVSINEGEGFLTPKILDELIEGTYTVNIQPLLESVSFNGLDYDENQDIPPFYVNFSDVLKEVSRYVREKTPGWFDEHIRVFREQTNGMFSMEPRSVFG